MAFRVIPPDEYLAWVARYTKAQQAIINREAEVDMVADQIERNMTLMGCTAIEDKLQEGVPESIAKLAAAGIKIWVLTVDFNIAMLITKGDKMETAINIGSSCNLLTKDMILIVIQADSSHKTENQLVEALDRFWNKDGSPKQQGSYALIIDGESLRFALEPANKALMLEFGCRCKAVICCRVSPLQKAKVVQMVRKGLVCLNDIWMILIFQGSRMFSDWRWFKRCLDDSRSGYWCRYQWKRRTTSCHGQ